MQAIARFDTARAALEACVEVDDVKEWADSAAALEAYARQTKDKEMRKMAVDIRMRAKRRIGELMRAQKLKRGRPSSKKVGQQPISLAEVGIDKNLANEAHRAAAMTPEAFEQAIVSKKAAIDSPDFEPMPVEAATFDAEAELHDAAEEAMTIVYADDQLAAAVAEIAKAKRETKTVTALYDALKADVAAHQRQAANWKRKAEKSALCRACKVNLERDDE
jgi:hypothetical protein